MKPLVMAVLGLAIHVVPSIRGMKTWIPGTGPGMTKTGMRDV